MLRFAVYTFQGIERQDTFEIHFEILTRLMVPLTAVHVCIFLSGGIHLANQFLDRAIAQIDASLRLTMQTRLVNILSMMPIPANPLSFLAPGVGSKHGSAAVVTTAAAPGPSAPGALSAAIFQRFL